MFFGVLVRHLHGPTASRFGTAVGRRVRCLDAERTVNELRVSSKQVV